MQRESRLHAVDTAKRGQVDFRVEDYAVAGTDDNGEDYPELSVSRNMAVYQQINTSMLREASTEIRRWDYEYLSAPGGRATLDGVQNGPYHMFLKGASPYVLQELLAPKRDLVTTSALTSHVYTYDILEDGILPKPEVTQCDFEGGCYRVEALELLRSRVLSSSIVPKARLIVVEELQPPVMEILGRTCRLPASLFKRHVANSWGGHGNSIASAIDPRVYVHGSSLVMEIPQPELLALRYGDQSQGYNITLRTAASFLQEERMCPLLHQAHVGRLYSVAFKHATVMIRQSASDSWQGQSWSIRYNCSWLS